MADVVKARAHAHHVQFYESTERLSDQVASFLSPVLEADGCGLVVARSERLPAFCAALRARDLDPDALVRAGRLQLLDAETALAAFVVDGHVVDERFRESVATAVASLAARGGPLRVYGEMVDVLWTAGNAPAVFDLEAQWGQLMREHAFALLCGYRIEGFEGCPAIFDRVLSCHDAASPTFQQADRYLMPGPSVATARALAQLEQRAHALQFEIDRRTRAEALMTELLAVTGELARIHEREDIARISVETASRAVGAVSAALWTVTSDGTHLELLAASEHEQAVAVSQYQRIPLGIDAPVPVAAATNQPIFLRSLDEYRERFAASFERIASVRASHHKAFAVLPLTAGDTALGSLCFTYDHERTFDEAERTFQGILGHHLGLALARAALVAEERAQRHAAENAARAEKQARADVETLYELIASLNRLDDIDAVYEYALRSLLRISRSHRAAILLLDASNVMRFRAHVGLSDAYRAAVEGHSPWKPDDTFPAPVAVDDTETDSAWASFRDVFRAEGIRSIAFVPIVHRRKLVGKFMLYRNDARPFEARDLQLTATVAVHVAQGVERKEQERELARAYHEERAAHVLAEEATRAREEIISVVSHDLRNPLGTILMGATTLLNAETTSDRARVHMAAERIQRQAERMARLIGDLVDFAGIQAGRLALERGTHAPESILTTTCEIFAPIAHERGLRLDTEAGPGLPAIHCDADRAVQVLSNLVSNALKVTPKGGSIAIGARPADEDIVFYVRDTGPGIEPDDLPNLFERYWRGKHASYKGAGLGLSIARGIVDAHGGRIWAESQVGGGSVFYFSLTRPAHAG